jgi:hypothetical protein
MGRGGHSHSTVGVHSPIGRDDGRAAAQERTSMARSNQYGMGFHVSRPDGEGSLESGSRAGQRAVNPREASVLYNSRRKGRCDRRAPLWISEDLNQCVGLNGTEPILLGHEHEHARSCQAPQQRRRSCPAGRRHMPEGSPVNL